MTGYYWIPIAVALCSLVACSTARALEDSGSHLRERREITSLISDLAATFFSRGGQQGVNELDNSNDKMSVLKRYLGSAIAGAIFGNGNDLISSILGFGNKGASQSSGSSYGGGSRGSDYGTSGTGNFAPVSTNSKTGVSVINSRPGERRPPPPSNRDSDYDSSSRRGSGSRASSGNDDEDYGSSRRNSGSRSSSGADQDEYQTSSRRDGASRGSSLGNEGSEYQPQASTNSKTGVSIINSRPGERRAGSVDTGRNRDRDTGASRRDFPDYEAGDVQSDMASRTRPDGALGGGNRGVMSGHGNFRSDAERFGDNRRGNADDAQSQGTRSGDTSRGAHSKSHSDSY